MPDFFTFTGVVSQTLASARTDPQNDPIVPEAELKWLGENPRQIARIRRIDLLMDDEHNLSVPMFGFSLRVLDPRETEGWRLATIYLPGAAPHSIDADETLDEVWRSVENDPVKENDFVLSAMDEAVYAGESWAEPLLRSLVLPDLSLLDPENWGLDFTPYKHRT